MAKRTRAEFERITSVSHIEEADGVSTSETEVAVTKGGLMDWPITGGVPSPATEGPTATGLVSDNKAAVEGSGEEGATANWATEGELREFPFWDLLARAGYTLW